MMKALDATYKLFPPAKAAAVAAELQEGDPDWTYTIVDDPKGTGYSYITIADEDGQPVGRV